VALAVLALVSCACGSSATVASTTSTSGATTPTTAAPSGPTTSAPSGGLTAPAASAADEARFVTEVGEVDPALATYEQARGDVALRALLTDGSAFCAFLVRGGGIDQALVAVAQGAAADESQTHLPQSVTTFNAVESVALLTLCPSEQSLLPSATRARIRSLGATLAGRSG